MRMKLEFHYENFDKFLMEGLEAKKKNNLGNFTKLYLREQDILNHKK